jgi:hypothetical protein
MMLVLLTTHYSLLTFRQNRLTKITNSRHLLPFTRLPPVSFEQYSLIILLDSNQNPCYHSPCSAREVLDCSPLLSPSP